MIISVVNDAQRGIELFPGKMLLLPGILSSAISLINIMDNMDMSPEVRAYFETNKTTLISINTKLKNLRKRSTPSGCFIATMVYGDYNHPQVLILRKFRDETLLNSRMGRIFVYIYYKTSPYLVKLLRNKKIVNLMIKKFIDILIKRIKK